MTRSGEQPSDPKNPASESKIVKLWTIKWSSAQLELADGRAVGGTMKEVSGSLFKEGDEAGTYLADGADADKATNTLKLWGEVTVRSTKKNATLTCQKLTWHADRGVLEASGEVKVVYKGYTLGPFDRLLCSPELQYVSTPDLFKEPK